jgi:hypothetical protein
MTLPGPAGFKMRAAPGPVTDEYDYHQSQPYSDGAQRTIPWAPGGSGRTFPVDQKAGSRVALDHDAFFFSNRFLSNRIFDNRAYFLCEAVATSRHGHNVRGILRSISQSLSQLKYVLAKVRFLYKRVWPQGFHQIVLEDDLPAVLQQHEQ